MKRILIFVLSILLILAACVPVSAHSGNTDSNGGHYDSSTGQYHYHHGYPAHQHKNGECPYGFDDKTDHQSGLLSSGNSSSGGCSSSEGCGSSVSWIYILVFGVAFLVIALFIWAYSDSGSSDKSNKPETTSQSTSVQSNKPAPASQSTSADSQKNIPKEDPEITKLKNEIQSLNRENKDLKQSVSYKDSLIKKHEERIRELEINKTKQIQTFQEEITQLEDQLQKTVSLSAEESEALKKEMESVAAFKSIFYPKLDELSKKYSSIFVGYPTLDAFYQQISNKRFHKSLVENISFGKKIDFKCEIVSDGKTYQTSLSECTCEDFMYRKVVCKHMLFVAYNTGVILLNKERMERHLKIYLDEIREKDPDQKKSSSKNGKNSI